MGLSPSGEYLVYVGSAFYPGQTGGQTGGQTEGAIYVYRFQSATGTLTPLGLAAETATPGFFAIHPSGEFLHAVNEIPEYLGKKSGAVSAFAIDKRTGRLQFLNTVPSGDPYPTYLTVDATGAHVLVSNYFGGVAIFPVSKDGRLGEVSSYTRETRSGSGVNPERQEAPHPHSVELSPDNRFVIAVDLGLDKLLVYRFDQIKAELTPNNPPFAEVNPGAGPRHIAFSPDARFVYSVNELQSSISAFAYDAFTGRLRPVQTISSVPTDFHDWNSGAEVKIPASGKFLYSSNRGHNSIAVFSIDPQSGKLAPVEHVSTGGKTPRNFEIDPSGSYLFAANEDSDSILLLRVDKDTGRLTTESKVNVTSPVCIKFLPLGPALVQGS